MKYYITQDEYGYWVKYDWFSGSRKNRKKHTVEFPEPQSTKAEAESTLRYWSGQDNLQRH